MAKRIKLLVACCTLLDAEDKLKNDFSGKCYPSDHVLKHCSICTALIMRKKDTQHCLPYPVHVSRHFASDLAVRSDSLSEEYRLVFEDDCAMLLCFSLTSLTGFRI